MKLALIIVVTFAFLVWVNAQESTPAAGTEGPPASTTAAGDGGNTASTTAGSATTAGAISEEKFLEAVNCLNFCLVGYTYRSAGGTGGAPPPEGATTPGAPPASEAPGTAAPPALKQRAYPLAQAAMAPSTPAAKAPSTPTSTEAATTPAATEAATKPTPTEAATTTTPTEAATTPTPTETATTAPSTRRARKPSQGKLRKYQQRGANEMRYRRDASGFFQNEANVPGFFQNKANELRQRRDASGFFQKEANVPGMFEYDAAVTGMQRNRRDANVAGILQYLQHGENALKCIESCAFKKGYRW